MLGEWTRYWFSAAARVRVSVLKKKKTELKQGLPVFSEPTRPTSHKNAFTREQKKKTKKTGKGTKTSQPVI